MRRLRGRGRISILLVSLTCGCSEGSDGRGPVTHSSVATAMAGRASYLNGQFTKLLSRNADVRRSGFDAIAADWSTFRDQLLRSKPSSDARRRIARAYLFAELGDERDLPVLRACFDEKSLVLHHMALRGIVRLRDRSGLEAILEKAAETAVDEVAGLLAAAFEIDPTLGERWVLRLARHERWATRSAAATAIRNCAATTSDTNPVRSVLGELLRDDVWCVQAEACGSATELRWTEVAPILRSLRDHEEWRVRGEAVRALARMGDAEAASSVEAMVLRDPVKYARIAAAEALADVEESIALPLLDKMLKDTTQPKGVRRAGLRVLQDRARGSQSSEAARRVLADIRSAADPQLTELWADKENPKGGPK